MPTIPARTPPLRAPRRPLRLQQLALVLALALPGCHPRPAAWADWMARPAPAPFTPVAPRPPLKPPLFAPPYAAGDGAQAGPGFDLAARNPDYPRTRIDTVDIDITDGRARARVAWTGPLAHLGPTGPWPVTAGRGNPGLDCNDVATSNVTDSLCTPKGDFAVAGFADHLNAAHQCHYVTWVVHAPRYIAIHSHVDLPDHPASAGCIRFPFGAAKLIHNNSVAAQTRVHIHGTWVAHPRGE